MVTTLEIVRDGDRTETLPLDGRPMWLGDGSPSAPEDADLCVMAVRGRVWAIITPAADADARSRGRPVLGGMTDLRAAPLTLNGTRYCARADRDGPRVGRADTATRCPICHQGIDKGDECYICSCGAITDSRFCAVGEGEEPRCFACGAQPQRKEHPQ